MDTFECAHSCRLYSAAALGNQVISTMIWYPPLSHYPDPDWTSPSHILLMLSTSLGCNKDQFSKSLLWFNMRTELLISRIRRPRFIDSATASGNDNETMCGVPGVSCLFPKGEMFPIGTRERGIGKLVNQPPDFTIEVQPERLRLIYATLIRRLGTLWPLPGPTLRNPARYNNSHSVRSGTAVQLVHPTALRIQVPDQNNRQACDRKWPGFLDFPVLWVQAKYGT